jgi:hypothetical protein
VAETFVDASSPVILPENTSTVDIRVQYTTLMQNLFPTVKAVAAGGWRLACRHGGCVTAGVGCQLAHSEDTPILAGKLKVFNNSVSLMEGISAPRYSVTDASPVPWSVAGNGAVPVSI